MAILRGTLVSFDNVTWLAEVRLDGSPWQSLSGVKTARNIAASEIVTGRTVLIDTGDHGDPDDAVVYAVWG